MDDFKAREKRFHLSEELRAYETSWTSSRLDGLKNAAVQILASYADTIAREIETQALRGALKGGFFKSVVRWLFSAVLFCAAVLSLMFALSRAGIDPVSTFQSLVRPPNATQSEPSEALPTTSSPVTPPRSAR